MLVRERVDVCWCYTVGLRCVNLRMPCQPNLRVPEDVKKKSAAEEEEEAYYEEDTWKKTHPIREFARFSMQHMCRLSVI